MDLALITYNGWYDIKLNKFNLDILLKSFAYCYLTLLILLNITQSFARSQKLHVLLCIIFNSIRQSFFYTQLNSERFLFLTILLIQRICLHTVYMSNSSIWPLERTWEQWQWMCIPYSINFQGWHILDTGWGSVYPLQRCSRCILHHQLTGLEGCCGLVWTNPWSRIL